MSERLSISVIQVGPIGTNCYILRDGAEGKEAVLVDPGDQPKRIMGALESLNAVPSAILLTHAHFDHVLGVNGIIEKYPDVKVYIAETERRMVEDFDLNEGFFRKGYVLTPDIYVQEGDVLELAGHRFEVLLTPGHTAGSCCYYEKESGSLFAGDTLFLESYGRTDFPTGSYEQIMASLKRLLTTLPEETDVYPGHGPQTTIGHEKMVEGF